MTAPAPAAPLDTLDAEALDWFVRQGRGLSPEETAAFDAWIAGHPERAAAMERWNADWTALDALPAAGIEQLRRQVAADKALESTPARGAATHVPPRRGFNALWNAVPRPALLAAVSFGVAMATVLVWRQWQQTPVFEQTFATRQGQQIELALPDGSQLRLDTATRAQVTLYRHRREVHLIEGQAMFQVERDPDRPFDVVTGPVQVTVIGTRFAVRHTPQVPGFENVRVEVEQGRVRVARRTDGRAGAESVELGAGQGVETDARGVPGATLPLPTGQAAPWREGRVTFDNVPLSTALAEFARYGRTGLVVHDDAVGEMRLSGTFDPARLANFRLALPKVLPVRLVSRESGATEIVATP